VASGSDAHEHVHIGSVARVELVAASTVLVCGEQGSLDLDAEQPIDQQVGVVVVAVPFYGAVASSQVVLSEVESQVCDVASEVVGSHGSSLFCQ